MKRFLMSALATLTTGVLACDSPTSIPPSSPTTAYPQMKALSTEKLQQVLPKDPDGKSVLLEVGGAVLTVGEPRRDAIGASARCSDMLTSCVSKTKDLDTCVRELPRCQTAEPWNEASPCCAEACVDAYQEQRRLGATPLESSLAVFGSTHECFPGLQDLYRASGGEPDLAPRRVAP